MDAFVFQNPENKPVEELKLKYLPDGSSYEEFVPALDQKWCDKEYVFTLYIPPPSKNDKGAFIMGSKEDWLERMGLFIGDVNHLLQIPYYRFWSEVVYNRHSLDGLNSFLQNAPPFYLRNKIPQDEEMFGVFKEAQELVFLLLMRLAEAKESEEAWMRHSTLGDILYNNFIISLPQLIETCMIYASDNFKEVTDLVNRIVEIQPKYLRDIEKSVPFICEVFLNFENQLTPAPDMNGMPSKIAQARGAISSAETLRLIQLLLDIGYSLATFLEVCSQAAVVFHIRQLESRIASFYENTIPVLSRHLDSYLNKDHSQDQYKEYLVKLNLSRHQFITSVHGCLTSCLSTILEERDGLTDLELKSKVDNYLLTVSDCLSSPVFVRDYNSAFPIHRELRVLSDICPDIDSLKFDFISESVTSLCDVPPKQKKTAKQITDPVNDSGSSPSTSSYSNKHIPHEECSSIKVTGVELESLVTEVKDILPDFGNGFIAKCLEHFNYVSADVINALLENALPQSLASIDRTLPIIPPGESKVSNGISERVNIFDNDEFDVMTRDKIDTSRVHKGKRQEKHKNLAELLDDKTHVHEMRDMFTQLSLVESEETVEYEDEYDDTYDDLDVPADDTHTDDRRAFVIPRVLQQQKRSAEASGNYIEEESEEEANEGSKADLFIENPADVRARAEQRRQEMRARGSGRSRAAFPHRDVVGKPKGQGQDKEVIKSREFKNANKSSRGNHNRRIMASRKRNQGMLPS